MSSACMLRFRLPTLHSTATLPSALSLGGDPFLPLMSYLISETDSDLRTTRDAQMSEGEKGESGLFSFFASDFLFMILSVRTWYSGLSTFPHPSRLEKGNGFHS